MKNELNDNERKVLAELYLDSAGNGHDFCFADVRVDGLTAHQVAGYIGQLVTKGYTDKGPHDPCTADIHELTDKGMSVGAALIASS